MNNIIIESFGGYQTACKQYLEENVIWRTTNPGLMEKLNEKGIGASSLEEKIKPSDCDMIGLAAHDFAHKVSKFLDDQCHWRKFVSFRGQLGLALAHLYYPLFYKGWLLAREFEKNDNDLVCVGNPKVQPPISLNFRFDRFDTLYAFIAERSNIGIQVVYHKQDRERLDELEKWVKERPMVKWEKLCSIINNTPSSFAYKIWRRLDDRGILKTACLWPKPRTNIFIHKDCELIAESFLGLLLHGSKFKRMPKLPEPLSIPAVSHMPEAESIEERIVEFALNAADRKGLDFGVLGYQIQKVCADIISERVCAVLADLHEKMNQLTESFKKVSSTIGEGLIMTNAFTSPIERMFGYYCLEKGVNVTSFEHGITYGLSEYSKFMAPFAGMLHAQTGVYHWKKSLEDLGPWSSHQRVIIGGVPKVMSKIRFSYLQRLLTRFWLGIPIKSQVVIYVAGSERNNMVYGPYAANDYQYFITTEAIVEELTQAYPDSLILLKLYPTHRYSESYKFHSLLNKYTNLRIIKDMDFCFIRTVADIVALSSSQSTLGWALGVNRKTLFFEYEANPAKLSGQVRNSAMPGVRRVIELDNLLKDSPAHDLVNQLLV